MTTITSQPHAKLKPGTVVRCRTRRYLVEDVQAPLEPSGDTVVSMACMEDDAIGTRLTVFREREIDFAVLGETSWEAVAQRGFDQPKQFAAYLNTLRWNCVTATDAHLFQAPYRAGIDVKAYQLEPLRKALQMPRVGLFIADDVGLGKTIGTYIPMLPGYRREGPWHFVASLVGFFTPDFFDLLPSFLLTRDRIGPILWVVERPPMKGHMSIPEFYRRFPNEAACAAFIAKRRWGTEPVCPHCGDTHIYPVSDSMGFKCAGCKKHFSVRTGTVMECSGLPLQTWLLAFYNSSLG